MLHKTFFFDKMLQKHSILFILKFIFESFYIKIYNWNSLYKGQNWKKKSHTKILYPFVYKYR